LRATSGTSQSAAVDPVCGERQRRRPKGAGDQRGEGHKSHAFPA
jgi:hypothetical protein